MEQIKAYSDIVFKFLMGREETKDLLISFINAVMEDSNLDLITSVELKNPFNLQDFSGDKLSVLDVKAVDETGRIIDIEVQCSGDRQFANRSLYYWAKLYCGQIAEAETYKLLQPVCCINLLNFTLLEEIKKFHSFYVLKEKDESETILTDHLMLHFIELPKVTDDVKNSHLGMWSQYFIHEGQESENMKTLLKNEPIIQKAHNEFKKFTADERLRDIYEARLKWQRDHAYFMDAAREEGLKQGMKEGIEQGIQQGEHHKATVTAVNMLKKGYSIEEISELTGLKESEIEKL